MSRADGAGGAGESATRHRGGRYLDSSRDVDDILIPLLSAGRSTAPGLPPGRPASSGPE
jgi:hypothetical protein